MSAYSDLPTSSSCIDLVIADKLTYGSTIEIGGSATSGTKNALAYDIDYEDGVVNVDFSECDLPAIDYSTEQTFYGVFGTYGMTVIDWTDDLSCSLIVHRNLTCAS